MNGERRADVDVEAANQSLLRDDDAPVQHPENVGVYALALAPEHERRAPREGERLQRRGASRLFQAGR